MLNTVRAVVREGKTARRIVDLHRGHAEIERHAVDGIDPAVGQQRLHVAKAPRYQMQAASIARLQVAIAFDRVGIPVDTPDDAVGRGQQGTGVAATAQRAVDVYGAGTRFERGDN